MAKRHLGQNFLFDPSILRRIVEVSGVTSSDTVVEIGPGHGRLTRLLSERAEKVIAIELDEELYSRAKAEVADCDNVALVHGDALKYPYGGLGSFKVVANIPYYLTTQLLFTLLESGKGLLSMTLTLQQEVAERIVAKPGTKAYGALSIAVQYRARTALAFTIPAGAFRPVPKVDSAVIHVMLHEKPPVALHDEGLFRRLVRGAFSQRRKTVSNALKASFPDIKEHLKGVGIEPTRRPGTLSIEEFAALANSLCEGR
jgi:16S rRNA (adenine1518-N6/adenine1519-N6)-dimethyltransferase